MQSTVLSWSLIFLLSSALLHSVWNLILKKITQKESSLLIIMTTAALFAIVLSPAIGGVQWPTLIGLSLTLIAGLFECGYFRALSALYTNASLGVSYAVMRGGATLIVTLVSLLFLNEPFSQLKIAAIGTLILGLFLCSYKTNEAWKKTSTLWSLLAAVCIGGYHLFYGFALEQKVTPATLFIISMISSMPYLALHNNKRALRDFKKLKSHEIKLSLFGGCFAGASFLLFLIGLSGSFPATAISLRNTSIIYSLLFGLLIKEKLTPKQMIGVFIIFLGAIGVSFN